ncbi:hypothetical protein GRI58_02050 [Porphyrobacter algicida]|uniref:Uncharacterized protein n=1 Tax=Qipengyuania algicida TaxID=1836209 RepID=A0A845AD51_9SPHN|nr:hypothetical protein [Qipengyuania algicida]MXP27604.1 hypothetical protein [Qipengyuania algicida]
MKRGWGPSPAKIKGRPLAVIAIILIGWIVFRASVIQLPVSERLRYLPIPRPALASQAGRDAPDAATMKQAQGDGSDTSSDVDSHFLPEPAPLLQRPIV